MLTSSGSQQKGLEREIAFFSACTQFKNRMLMLTPYLHNNIKAINNFTLARLNLLLVQFLFYFICFGVLQYYTVSVTSMCHESFLQCGRNAKWEFPEFAQELCGSLLESP